MMGRDRRLERDALRLRPDIAVTVLGKEQPLPFLKRGLEISGLADQPRLAFLADGAFEDRLDEDHAMTVDHRLDFGLVCLGSEHFRMGKVDETQQLGAVQHAAELHGTLPLTLIIAGKSADTGRQAKARQKRVKTKSSSVVLPVTFYMSNGVDTVVRHARSTLHETL
jgi:hypothetical protein